MRVSISILTVLMVSSFTLFGAIAPMSPKDLEKTSDLIITGKVIGVTSIIKKSKIEKSFGIHRDKIFYITINVTEILKGKSACRDQKIDIRVWRPSLRIPPITGPQGHYPIPVKGDRVRVYIKMVGEKKYSALLPNGFRIIN